MTPAEREAREIIDEAVSLGTSYEMICSKQEGDDLDAQVEALKVRLAAALAERDREIERLRANQRNDAHGKT